MDDTWTNHPMPKVSPPDTPTFLELGPVVFSDSFPAAFLNSLVAVTNGAMVLRPLDIIETNVPPRRRLYRNASAVAVHTTATFGVGYPQDWIVGAYGAPPGYLSGAALAAWYAERDPSRTELSLELLSTSAVPVYLQQMSNDVPNVGGTNLLAVYSNDIAFVSFRHSAGLRRLLLHAPMEVALLDLFRASALPPAGEWTHVAVLGHGSDPVPYADGSGLSNAFYALANAVHDGDGDGLASGRELFLYGTSATTNDTDGDGLMDAIELLAHGTNPNHADTDGDGLPDGWEVANGVPPGAFSAYWDSDLDGLSDLQEFLLGTNPRSNDSDLDHIPDRWEAIHGLGPHTADAEADPNQNGVSNWEEYLNGTDPRAYTSSVGLVSVAGTFNGWNTQANRMRRVGPHRWRAVIELPVGVVEFKFVGEARWDSGVVWGGSAAVTSAVPIVAAPLVLVADQYNVAANILAGGLYQFDLDEAQNHFSVTAVAQADFTTAEPLRYRLVGTFNQWDLTDEPMQMTPVGDGWYHLRVSDFWEAVTELKIVEGDTWLVNWGAPSTATYGPEGVLTVIPAGPNLRLHTAAPSGVYHLAFHPASGALEVRVAGTDADQDGLLAAEESYLGTSDAMIDSDEDGWDDAPERVSGSDPAAAQSVPSTEAYLPVELRIQDADLQDDVWEVRWNGRRVLRNTPLEVASTVLALPFGKVAQFTLRRIGAGQWTGHDEYKIGFSLPGELTVSPCWQEGEGNSPTLGTLYYTGPSLDIPPRTSHLRWTFEPRKVAIEQAEYAVCRGDTAATEIRLTADSYDAPGYLWSSEPPGISGSGRVLSIVPASLPGPASYTVRVESLDPYVACSAEATLRVLTLQLETPTENQEFHMSMSPPTMPVVELRAADNPGVSGLEYRFQVGNPQSGRALEYEDAPATDYMHPTLIDSGWINTHTWNITFGGDIYGGHVTHVTVSLRRNGRELCSQTFQRDFWLLGSALSSTTFDNYMATKNLAPQKLIMAQAIARSEGFGSATQFDPGNLSTASHPRYPLKDAVGGYGVYQLTSPVPARHQIWDWQDNVDAGLVLLDQKMQIAEQRLNQHPPYTDEQLRLETYSAYNGGFYHVWQGGQWIADPDYACGCDGNPRKGQETNPPLGNCRPLSQCYSDVTHSME